MEEQQHLSDHTPASSSQNYQFASSSLFFSSHHPYMPPSPAPTLREVYQPTNIIPGSYPAPSQQHPDAQHHGFHQGGQLVSNKRSSDAQDSFTPTSSSKKQALSTNADMLHSNFAFSSSSIPVDNLQEIPGPSKAYPPASQITPTEHPSSVIGLAISSDASSDRGNGSHHTDIASKTSLSSPSASMQISSKELNTTDQQDAIRSRTSAPAMHNSRRTYSPKSSHRSAKAADTPSLHHLPDTCKMGHLPDGMSYKRCGKSETDVCVVTKEVIDKGHVFRPVQGDVKTLDCLHNTQAWELCFYGNVAAYVVPNSRKEWMGYVRSARFPEECNLEAGQVYGRIHFTVTRRIEPGSELKVFYSDVYRENCGFMYDLAALNYDKDTDDFACTMCNIRVKDSKSMVRHYKFTHPHSSSKAPPVKVRKRMHPLGGHPTPELGYSGEERSEASLKTKERDEERLESDGSSGDGAEWLEEDGSDQSLGDGRVSQRLICMTCGKNFQSWNQLVMHKSFHDAEEVEEDDLDEEGEEDNMEDDEEELNDDDEDEVVNEQDDSIDEKEVAGDFEDDEDPRCSICGFAIDEDKLKGHQARHKTHSFQCDKCGRLYMRKVGLYRHRREVHGAVVIRPRRNVNVFLRGFTASNTPQLKAAVPATSGDPQNGDPLEPNRCKVCNFLASSASDLRVHLDRHKDKPFGCEQCGVVFLDRTYLYKHLRKQHGALKEEFLTPYRRQSILKYLSERALRGNRCEDCGYSCVSRDEFNEHVFKHRNAPFGCKECGRVFRFKEARGSHKCTANDEGAQDNVFEANKSNLNSGMQALHKEGNENTCLRCGFKTLDGALLVVHINSHGKSPFGCKKCGNTYKCKRSLTVHMLSKHRTVSDDESSPKSPSSSSMGPSADNLEVNREPCPHCGYYTPHKSVLAEHLENHKKHPHGCMDCGNTYSALNILYRHKREKHNGGYLKTPRRKKSVETIDLPDNLKICGDTCARCGFQSSDQGFLADHAILHLTHPFGCIDCGNVYTTRKCLQRHKKEKHSPLSEEEKLMKPIKDPNTCSKCGFTCSIKTLLEEHKRKHRIAEYGCDVCGEVFPEDKFVVLHKQEKHFDLLEGLKEEVFDIVDEDYLESGFTEIDVSDEMKMIVRDANDQSEEGGE